MEGLLGGLVQNKDPRAEIVRAELEAMAREAEMTGLKLRRSKAFEQLDQQTKLASTAPDTDLQDSDPTPGPSTSTSTSSSSSSSSTLRPRQIRPQTQQHLQQRETRYVSPAHHSRPSSPSQLPDAELKPTHTLAPMLSSSQLNESSYPLESKSFKQPQQYHPIHEQHVFPRQPESHSLTHAIETREKQKVQYSVEQPMEESEPQHFYKHSADQPTGVHPSSLGTNLDQQRTVGWRHGASRQVWDDTSNNAPASSKAESCPAINPLIGYMAVPQGRVHQDPHLLFPSATVVDHLLDVHFQFVHPVLPMLHPKTLRDQCYRRDYPPPHLFFAILGLASRFSDNPIFRSPQPGADWPPCSIFYERAKQLIKDEYDDSQVWTVQALLLMAIQQMGFCESQRAWLYVGMAIRMAQDLGLNKVSSQEQSRDDRLHAELKKRTWWSCYVVERLVCGGLGRPLTITAQECETGLPQFIDDDTDKVDGSSAVEQISLVSNFVYLISLSRIQGNILQFIKARVVRCDDALLDPNRCDYDHTNRIDTSQAAFSTLDRALTEWRQSLPDNLQSTTMDSPHFGLFLHMTYNALIILLHRPEIAFSATSASLCNQAAATITNITGSLMQANALTSMFVSCIYAIFSAGVIHFLNITAVKRHTCDGSTAYEDLPSHTSSSTAAKSSLKRCIDALKDLSNHWVSAARRAKILEDLLDLKHVSLKDLEGDSFKTTPLLPSWAVEAKGRARILSVPGEGHDQLRQKCRSKVMAIQSLLANDDEFQRMQNRRSFSVEATPGTPDYDHDYDMASPDDHSDSVMDVSPCAEIVLPAGPTQTARSPRTQTHTRHDSDPMMLMSTTTNFGSEGESMSLLGSSPLGSGSGSGSGEGSFLTHITLTTMSRGDPSAWSQMSKHGTEEPSHTEMLDPFSVPSSITFSSSNHGRQASGNGGVGNSTLVNTVWSTDAQTHRTIARVESPAFIGKLSLSDGDMREEKNRSWPMQELSFTDRKSSSRQEVCLEHEEDQDLAWNDMPPTLGLDEWMAYIGALMMRWLASGESPPRSPPSR
ncbi:hypothetical protein BGX28_005816 [Mortierella sp. GBA30]|nr:hypothetical protein BGX28_005816 [Mortierella sp. GBA30]